MNLDEALRSSSVAAARGYDESGKCVVSVAYYGGHLVWLTGWGGAWAKKWEPIPEDKKSKLDALEFRPTGARQRDAYEAVLAEIFDEDFDEFVPFGDDMKD